jgi:hypothetical protein
VNIALKHLCISDSTVPYSTVYHPASFINRFQIAVKMKMKQKMIRYDAKSCCRAIGLFLLLLAGPCSSLSMGSAAKPYQKQKVCVFGPGGYLGGCIFGFLQRCGSLYGTGISGVQGSPRGITATAFGSVYLNSVLSKNFILAQADESFIKLTDMSSVDAIKERVLGFDAAILATRCTVEKRPVTLGSYEKGPNDKTTEFYMDRPRSSTVRVNDDPEFSMELFQSSLEACREGGIKRVVVVETDGEFENPSLAGDKYLNALNSCGISYTYIRPSGRLENFPDYTFAKGVQGNLKVDNMLTSSFDSSSETDSDVIYREDLAALCVQSLLSLDWNSNSILQVRCTGPASMEQTALIAKEWCVNSKSLESLLDETVVAVN